ncbi:MAG TPA: cation:proton antiporter [Gaiellaceae bacterium]|nr:cation:proton antiporter [Gaiellaceae bacterium]
MHWQLATLALILLGFAAISGRIEGTSITAPIVFTVAGVIVGARSLGLIDLEQQGEEIKLLTEATLTVVLFSEASRIDLRALRGEAGVPARLLGIGLPLTLLAGFVAALAVLGQLAWSEALLLAVILAPTDAALGQVVVTSKRLPSRVRQSLNVESGLNDGICVPLFFVVLAVAQAEETEAGWRDSIRLVLEQLGYGALAGVGAGVAAAAVVIVGVRQGSIVPFWLQVVPLAGAALAFGLAQPIGGSGFIAAWVGGAFFGGLRRREGGDVSYLIDETGALLAAITFIVFGAVLLVPALESATWQVALYAVLSLTLIRMVPVGLAMLGTGTRRPTVAFLGWFGPRGLASIVFALLLVEEGGLPNDEVILVVTFVTVGVSVFAHGVSAAPLARRYSEWLETHPRPAPRPVEEDDDVSS